MDKEYIRHLKAKYFIEDSEILKDRTLDDWKIEYSISLKKFYVYTGIGRKWFYLRPDGTVKTTCGADGFYDLQDDCHEAINQYLIGHRMIDFIDKEEMEV